MPGMVDSNREKRPRPSGDVQPDLERYHIELIQAGIRQADAGELVPHREVEKMIARLLLRK